MSNLIAYCGLDCAQCEAYQSTQANDTAWQERLVVKWSEEFHNQMTLKDVTCDGCRGPRLGGYCPQCPVRSCATARGLETCADCPDYACEELKKFFTMAPAAKEHLELLRIH